MIIDAANTSNDLSYYNDGDELIRKFESDECSNDSLEDEKNKHMSHEADDNLNTKNFKKEIKATHQNSTCLSIDDLVYPNPNKKYLHNKYQQSNKHIMRRYNFFKVIVFFNCLIIYLII
jgi:hypothetical protein